MLVRKLEMVAALTASTLLGVSTVAQASGAEHGWQREYNDDDDDHRYRNSGYREDSYYEDRPTYYRGREVESRRYDRESRPRQGCRTKGTTGLILGGAAGALLGREIDRRGSRTPGTIIGAGAGALVGRELARKNRC